MRTFSLKLVDGEIVNVREVARIGAFVVHTPWEAPKGRKKLVITHEPTMKRLFESHTKIVKALINGSRSGKTLARIAEAAQQDMINPNSRHGIACRASIKYRRKLEETLYL
jgi:hypothetical protein